MPAAHPNMSCRCNNYQVTHMQVRWTHDSGPHKTTQGLMRENLMNVPPDSRARWKAALRQAFNKHVQIHTVLWQREQAIGVSPFPFDAVQNLYLGSSLQPAKAHMILPHSRALAATDSPVHWSICVMPHTTCIAHSVQLLRVQPSEKAKMPCT